MSIFIGSNAGDIIEPGNVSPNVTVIGNPKTPSAAVDLIFGGNGDDRVAAGGGNDIAFLGGGNDLFTWNAGDGSDIVDGGSGTDTLAFNGSAAAETIKLSTGILGTIRVSNNVENVNMTLAGMERIVIKAGAGNDVVDASALPAGQATLEIFGGDGNDLLIGSAGNDSFVWNPGDDNDALEGRAGLDTMLFNGAVIGEQINVLANGQRVLFTRDIANVVMDLNDVERIDFNALGGADKVTVHELSGTDVTEVNVNLAGTLGGSTGDGAADQVIVNGSGGNDTILAFSSGTSASVQGLAAVTNVANFEAALDQLIVDGLGGNDTLIGGAGSQVLRGGEGDDVISGGDGDDHDVRRRRQRPDGLEPRRRYRPRRGRRRRRHRRGQWRQRRRDLHRHRQRHARALRPPRPGPLLPRHRHDRGPGRQHQRRRRHASRPPATWRLIKLTVDGGAGNDTILGSNGADMLIGGDGNDFIDGQQGNDVAFLGAGDDTFQWDPGDGSDTVEGQAGHRQAAVQRLERRRERSTSSANGERVRFTRDVGTIVMDLNDVEQHRLQRPGRGRHDHRQ